MGVMTPATTVLKGATCESKLANDRPRRLSGSQKIAGSAMGSPAVGAHDSTAALLGNVAGGTAAGFAVMHLLGVFGVPPPNWRSPAGLTPRTAGVPLPKATSRVAPQPDSL